ncbi:MULTISPECIES: hypothetical protein [Pseudonocardia]|uniref:Uncharacterized protein n=2 Tax=Pseudonocardia TaxID=1847 RepID=A0A1Y2MHR4_PSEAH|nr:MULTISPECIES: hypothetical protein [Pseudonocardia]OSY34509.1 hypothetical protein BG845_06784 [Pseudonocardia autotrophica]TDN65676.1 hypothetical protein C8E95_7189 [Pseudonocardia autotrophica]BBG05827.1 hypothetical protein Pdca_70360 [Pseudonocardia autotrophica]GEC29646.1 hypothetical protein PSA01_66750 [Pseudonocardia saturnea]
MNRPECSVGEIGARLAAALSTLDEQTWRVTEPQGRVGLVSAGGDRLELHMRGYGPQAGRVIVGCGDPDDARDVPMPELGATITVSPARPAEHIAADVSRRLLRAYRAVRPAARGGPPPTPSPRPRALSSTRPSSTSLRCPAPSSAPARRICPR